MKRVVTVMLVLGLMLGVFAFAACELPDEDCTKLEEYKIAAIAELDDFVYALDSDDFSAANWARIKGYATDGVAVINAAEDKAAVRAAVDEAKRHIGSVRRLASSFPSVVEEFAIDDFDEEFFESYTLIRVSFSIGSIIYGDFYTIFIEDGKLNLIFEVTELTFDTGLGGLVAYIIMPNEIFERYEIGAVKRFYIYDYESNPTAGDWFADDELMMRRDREWLSEIYKNSAEHIVAEILPYPDWNASWLYENNLTNSTWISLVAITSIEEFTLALS